MRSLWARECSYLVTSRRAVVALGALLLLVGMATYGGAYANNDLAAYWALVFPATFAFAHGCGLTSRERESGLSAMLSTTSASLRSVLLTRWAIGAVLGLLGVLFGLALLLTFHQLGLAWSAREVRYLLAAPVLALAASGLGIAVGALLGTRSSNAGAATAGLGAFALVALPAVVWFFSTRLRAGSVGSAFGRLLGGFSPVTWVLAFGRTGEWTFLALLLAFAGVCVVLALLIPHQQTPTGIWHGHGARRALAALALAGLLLAGTGLASPPPDSRGFAEGPNALGVNVAILSRAEDGGTLTPLAAVPNGNTVPITVALWLHEDGKPRTNVRVTIERADAPGAAIGVIEPATFEAKTLAPAEGSPSAAWNATLRMSHPTSFTDWPAEFLVRVESDEASGTKVISGPVMRKGWSEAAEFGRLALVEAVAIAVLAVPFLARRTRISRLASGQP